MLSEKNTQNIADMENLRQQLVELMKENERREAFPAEEKNKVNRGQRLMVVMVLWCCCGGG